jgi:hypothetical protein
VGLGDSTHSCSRAGALADGMITVDFMAELVITLGGVIQLVAAGAVVGILVNVVGVAKMKAVAKESDFAGPVTAYSWLISRVQRLTIRPELTVVGAANESHDGGDGNGDDGAKDDGGISVRHGARL